MAENHDVVELGNTNCDCSASPSSPSMYHSTRMEELLQSQTDYETTLDFDMAASKGHWSELLQPLSVVEDPSGGEKGKAPLSNNEIVLSLQRQFPQTGSFFNDFGDVLLLGKKIAEGGQAEIFEVKFQGFPVEAVLKAFKEGSSVLDLQKQWPQEMFKRQWSGFYGPWFGCSPVFNAKVVMNGRFAFMMHRCTGDLRTLIDKRMERNNNRLCAPFSDWELERNMYQIAGGMKGLHKENIVHRDLKASNVLVDTRDVKDLDAICRDRYRCLVADYECSVGVVGTGFGELQKSCKV